MSKKEILLAYLRDVLPDDDSLDLSDRRGRERVENCATGYVQYPRSNGTRTITITVNGGARHTEGAAVLGPPAPLASYAVSPAGRISAGLAEGVAVIEKLNAAADRMAAKLAAR